MKLGTGAAAGGVLPAAARRVILKRQVVVETVPIREMPHPRSASSAGC
jgi:hypothetical protein